MNAILDAWNIADEATAYDAMIACCGAMRWAKGMVALRPMSTFAELSEAADRIWATTEEPDWLEAFACHPRIGERKSAHAVAKSAAWSKQEQSSAASASENTLAETQWRLSGSAWYCISTAFMNYSAGSLVSVATHDRDGVGTGMTDSLAYAYDANGNRTKEEDYDGTPALVYRIVYTWRDTRPTDSRL